MNGVYLQAINRCCLCIIKKKSERRHALTYNLFYEPKILKACLQRFYSMKIINVIYIIDKIESNPKSNAQLFTTVAQLFLFLFFFFVCFICRECITVSETMIDLSKYLFDIVKHQSMKSSFYVRTTNKSFQSILFHSQHKFGLAVKRNIDILKLIKYRNNLNILKRCMRSSCFCCGASEELH